MRTNQVVGFANVWLDNHNNIAIIEPFETAPSHQKRGLVTNLLYEYAPLEGGRRKQTLHQSRENADA
ncbi:GNAT family N-acetyltransferase [Paenibacillus puerhi]|uniref:GNAT family N-acetyltransferase n=1 Tax=Paenibacillus puerhi TaxID=2692622 RepID=UPI001F164F54|nr:GNAT family N-acetyltransferase [Paenibacillus puerhi]